MQLPPNLHRDSKAHTLWRHELGDGKGVMCSTSALSEYPKGYCVALTRAYRAFLSRVGSGGREFPFLEIFSGPNSPLTREVKLALADPLVSSLPWGPLGEESACSKTADRLPASGAHSISSRAVDDGPGKTPVVLTRQIALPRSPPRVWWSKADSYGIVGVPQPSLNLPHLGRQPKWSAS